MNETHKSTLIAYYYKLLISFHFFRESLLNGRQSSNFFANKEKNTLNLIMVFWLPLCTDSVGFLRHSVVIDENKTTKLEFYQSVHFSKPSEFD